MSRTFVSSINVGGINWDQVLLVSITSRRCSNSESVVWSHLYDLKLLINTIKLLNRKLHTDQKKSMASVVTVTANCITITGICLAVRLVHQWWQCLRSGTCRTWAHIAQLEVVRPEYGWRWSGLIQWSVFLGVSFPTYVLLAKFPQTRYRHCAMDKFPIRVCCNRRCQDFFLFLAQFLP